MRLSSVKSVEASTNNSNNNNKNTSFRGMSDGLVKFWQVVDNSRALQFTVEDMLGTNIPRTYKGAMAGYKYTGKINTLALAQEAIREFLTGPTMCAVPIAVLALATKCNGKTSNTHVENIKNLGYILGKTAEAAPGAEFEKAFFENAVSDLLKQTIGKEDINPDDIKKLSNCIAQHKNLMYSSNKQDKKALGESLETIQDLFASIVKREKDSFKDTSFLNVKYSIDDSAIGSTKFKNYVEYMGAYVHDFAKKYGSEGLNDKNITAFKNSWIGKRMLIAVSMVAITGLVMSFIPKIYTFFSGGVNPNASAIYDEAKNENKKGGN